jgi:hypothetical protein
MPCQTELPFISFHGKKGEAGEQFTSQNRRMEDFALTVGIQMPVVSWRRGGRNRLDILWKTDKTPASQYLCRWSWATRSRRDACLRSELEHSDRERH